MAYGKVTLRFFYEAILANKITQLLSFSHHPGLIKLDKNVPQEIQIKSRDVLNTLIEDNSVPKGSILKVRVVIRSKYEILLIIDKFTRLLGNYSYNH